MGCADLPLFCDGNHSVAGVSLAPTITFLLLQRARDTRTTSSRP